MSKNWEGFRGFNGRDLSDGRLCITLGAVLNEMVYTWKKNIDLIGTYLKNIDHIDHIRTTLTILNHVWTTSTHVISIEEFNC